jgi:hypothetical protein
MKNKLRNFVFAFLYISGMNFVFRSIQKNKKITVLLFHAPSAKAFCESIEILSKTYNFISFTTLFNVLTKKANENLPQNAMLITFDDGRNINRELVENDKFDFPPMINFLSSAAHRRDGKKFVNDKGLTDLRKIFDIQAHTNNHLDLTSLGESSIRDEYVKNISDLNEELGYHPNILAYPYGKYNDLACNIAQEVGFNAAFTVDPGFVFENSNPFKLKRICISDQPSKYEILVKSSGFWDFLKGNLKGK